MEKMRTFEHRRASKANVRKKMKYIVVCGPTASGKDTVIEQMLKEVNQENPGSLREPGITQPEKKFVRAKTLKQNILFLKKNLIEKRAVENFFPMLPQVI